MLRLQSSRIINMLATWRPYLSVFLPLLFLRLVSTTSRSAPTLPPNGTIALTSGSDPLPPAHFTLIYLGATADTLYPATDFHRLLTHAITRFRESKERLRYYSSFDSSKSHGGTQERHPLVFEMASVSAEGLSNTELIHCLGDLMSDVDRAGDMLRPHQFAIFRDLEIFADARGRFVPHKWTKAQSDGQHQQSR